MYVFNDLYLDDVLNDLSSPGHRDGGGVGVGD